MLEVGERDGGGRSGRLSRARDSFFYYYYDIKSSWVGIAGTNKSNGKFLADFTFPIHKIHRGTVTDFAFWFQESRYFVLRAFFNCNLSAVPVLQSIHLKNFV